MRIQLEGRRVLVTAGASGIGWAMSVAFAEAGAQVHVCDIDDGLLETAASRGMRT